MPLFDTNTYAEVVLNIDFLVRIVQAPGSNFVHVVLRDGSFAEIWEHGTDHEQLMAAIDGLEVPA